MTDLRPDERKRRQSTTSGGARLDAWVGVGLRDTRAQHRLTGFGAFRSSGLGERGDRLLAACEALHGNASSLSACSQTRVEVSSVREHFDQGGELWRDRALAPDENRR